MKLVTAFVSIITASFPFFSTCASSALLPTLKKYDYEKMIDHHQQESPSQYSDSNVNFKNDWLVIHHDNSPEAIAAFRKLQSSPTWSQLGADIDGEIAGDQFGHSASVSLSKDGSIIAVGAPYNDENGGSAGHVKVF